MRFFRRLGTASKTTLGVVSLALLGLAAGGAYVALAAPKPEKPKITSGPADPTNQTSATFTYTHKISVSFLCSLDGGPFTACGSGTSGSKLYPGPLADGSHTFQVKAQNGSAVSDPATWTWTVDTVPPPPPTLKKTPDNPTSDTHAHFESTDTESGVTFQCSLDGGPFVSCGSGKDYDNLALGSHTFQVKAVDKAGNVSAPTSFTWTILAPKPAKPKITSGPADPTNQTSASFTYTDNSSVDFLCSLDGGPFTACGSGTSGSQAYAGPLADGPHTFEVEATQQGGGMPSDADSWTWTVDTLPPPQPTFKKTPDSSTDEDKAHFEYEDAEAGVDFQCSLDGAAYVDCGGSKNYDHLAVGLHMFCVKALDEAENASTPACWTWVIGGVVVPFEISGSPLAGVLLYPGASPVPINLVFTNPNIADITIQMVTVTVTGTSAGGCGAGNFSVTHQLSATPTIPAGETKSLQDLGVDQSDWPQLQMIDSGNQDACKNATVDLSFSGTAQG